MLKGIYGKRRFLDRFQYGCEKDLTLNQLAFITVDRTAMDNEFYVTKISVIPDETVGFEKG